jgi:hypothetical protein
VSDNRPLLIAGGAVAVLWLMGARAEAAARAAAEQAAGASSTGGDSGGGAGLVAGLGGTGLLGTITAIGRQVMTGAKALGFDISKLDPSTAMRVLSPSPAMPSASASVNTWGAAEEAAALGVGPAYGEVGGAASWTVAEEAAALGVGSAYAELGGAASWTVAEEAAALGVGGAFGGAELAGAAAWTVAEEAAALGVGGAYGGAAGAAAGATTGAAAGAEGAAIATGTLAGAAMWVVAPVAILFGVMSFVTAQDRARVVARRADRAQTANEYYEAVVQLLSSVDTPDELRAAMRTPMLGVPLGSVLYDMAEHNRTLTYWSGPWLWSPMREAGYVVQLARDLGLARVGYPSTERVNSTGELIAWSGGMTVEATGNPTVGVARWADVIQYVATLAVTVDATIPRRAPQPLPDPLLAYGLTPGTKQYDDVRRLTGPFRDALSLSDAITRALALYAQETYVPPDTPALSEGYTYARYYAETQMAP